MSDTELASFPCSYSTAENMLERANVGAGDWVLISGASGGVGGALLQLARRRGAKTVALTSRSKMEGVRAIGTHAVLDRRQEDLAQAVRDAADGPIDVFADVVGGALFPELLETIRVGGRYVTAGAVAGPIVPLDLRTLYLHDLAMHGATVVPPEVFANLVSYIEQGDLRPLVAAVYTLDQLSEAQKTFMARTHVGAVVVEVNEPG